MNRKLSDLIASLVCFTHDLITLFALPLSYDCFPHTSLMVWELPSQLPDSLRTSSHFPYCLSAFLHFSHGLRTSHILPSRSEGFPHSLMVSVLPDVSEYEQDISLIKGRSAWIYSCMDLFYVFLTHLAILTKGSCSYFIHFIMNIWDIMTDTSVQVHQQYVVRWASYPS